MAMTPATATPTGTSREAEAAVAARALTSPLAVADFSSQRRTGRAIQPPTSAGHRPALDDRRGLEAHTE